MRRRAARSNGAGQRTLRLTLASAAVAALAACGRDPGWEPPLPSRIAALYQESRGSQPKTEEISVGDLRRLLDSGSTVTLVDVREPVERAVSAIPGSVEAAEFERRGIQGPGEIVVAYCTIGARSTAYTRRLRDRGVLAANLAGGILAWVGEGMPVTDSRGVPVRRVHVFGPKWNALPPGYKAVW